MVRQLGDDLGGLPDHRLRKTRRNETITAITQAALAPDEFNWKAVEGLWNSGSAVSAIFHNPTGSYFVFDGADASNSGYDPTFYSILKPGRRAEIEKVVSTSWESQRQIFIEWLRIVKCEHESPDLWDAAISEKRFIRSAAELEERPFTKEERKLLSARIVEAKSYVFSVSTGLSEADRQFISSQFDYLDAASSRMGRKDWINVAITVVLAIVFCDSTVQDRAKEIFQVVMTMIAGIVNLAGQAAGKILPRIA